MLLAADPGGRLLRHYDRTILADESYFQTLAGNRLALTEIARPRRYILWTDSPHPEVLTIGHLPDILRSDAHFARKFDAEIDATVLDELDRLHA